MLHNALREEQITVKQIQELIGFPLYLSMAANNTRTMIEWVHANKVSLSKKQLRSVLALEHIPQIHEIVDRGTPRYKVVDDAYMADVMKDSFRNLMNPQNFTPKTDQALVVWQLWVSGLSEAGLQDILKLSVDL